MTVTGIYRATPLRVNPRQRTVKAVYKTYIDVIHFRKADNRRLRGREEEEGDEVEGEGNKKTFTAERIEQLKQLSKTPDIYERLSRALGMWLFIIIVMCYHRNVHNCLYSVHVDVFDY